MSNQLGRGNWAEYQKLVLSELQKHHEDLEKVEKGLSDANGHIVSINKDLDSVNSTLEVLLKLVRDGNGKKPLLERVAILERHIENSEKIKRDNISSSRFNWQTAIAIMGLVIALLSALLAVLL